MKRAFTLLELLIAVLIIGILAVVIMPKFDKALSRARLSEAYATIGAIKKTQEAYYLGNGFYADEIESLDTELPANDVRKFDYGTQTGIGLISPNGEAPGNNQIYTTMVTDQNHANKLAPEFYHPHAHESGEIGVWEDSNELHTHGDITHRHGPVGWETIP
ncbi:MAG: type II secretion system protein [Candidatus Omnitrophica bacterium]|nr:type II secretion system protein [Candidatus Omnitrophota bacterium]